MSPENPFFENAPDGLVALDAQTGQIRECNRRYCELTGHTAEDICGEELTALRRAGQPATADVVSTLQSHNGGTDWQLHTESDTVPVEVRTATMTDDGEELVVVRVSEKSPQRDGAVTKRSEATEQFGEFERLIENFPIGVFQSTPGPDGAFTFVNEAMVDIFGADSKQQLLDHPVSGLYVDESERERLSEQLLDRGVVVERELELQTVSGETLWGAVTAISRTVDGETTFDGVIQDITARKQSEQRLKEQRDNLEVLNQMLRHDIRNDLQIVRTYATLLADQVEGEEREYIETIEESTSHAVELTQTARDLADTMLSAETEHRAVTLRTPLVSEIDDVRSEYPNAMITVEQRLPAVTVVADEMLASVFRNLLTNAVQHNHSEIPEVSVATEVGDETVRISIADNGPGIPDNQKETIFGKGEKGLESEGTGIGLYLVKSLVESYGGTVWIEDNDPNGAVFVVELPRTD